ncbi:hypothetical protein PR048_024266 [Dryococelus australis]|uniref:Uncharacterized protein n=1 Tax=Dryococelus australis TaxID=614101 RepID=A0ABQ9GN62_9NEOP|nr:hypothetical protein PR048_024266 [Dryococelus australis]
MKQRQLQGWEETGDPEKNPPTSGIVLHNFHMRKKARDGSPMLFGRYRREHRGGRWHQQLHLVVLSRHCSTVLRRINKASYISLGFFMAKIKDGTKKRGLWTQDVLSETILVVKEKGLPAREPFRRNAVSRRTLRRYLCDESNVKAKLYCKSTLSAEQEQELCLRIFRLCDVGYLLTSKVLHMHVFRYCSGNDISQQVRYRESWSLVVHEENDILLYGLSSYTTHELQPLDKGCFQSIEIYWGHHALLYLDVHKDENDISKLNFGNGNMKSGFKATGICPFNPLIIPEEAFAPSAATELPPPEPVTDEQDIAEKIPPESTFANPTSGTSSSPRLPLSRPKPVTVTSTSRKRPRTLATSSTNSDVISPSADAPDSSDNGEHEMSQTPDSRLLIAPLLNCFQPHLERRKQHKKPAINSRGLLLSKRLIQEI